MSTLAQTHERQLHGGMSIETTVYEDGYISSVILDVFGNEIGSLDGHERSGGTRKAIENYLYDQYAN